MNRARTLAWISAVAVGVAATSALAGGGLKTTSKTETVATNEVRSVSATCKADRRVVSGGFKAERDPDALSNPDLLVTASRRAPGRKWTITAANESIAGDLTAYVNCRDRRLRTATETVELPAGATDTMKASCPAGTKAISGGYEATPADFVAPTTPFMRTSASRRSGPRGWKASVFNNGNEGGEVKVYVHCRRGDATKVRTRSKALIVPEVATIKPRCKRGERVLAGGFASPEPGKGAAVIIVSRKRGARTWLVQARTGQSGAPVEVTAYAYCEKKR